MASESASTGKKLRPQTRWRVVTDAPLRGLALARESSVLLSWDESDQIVLWDSEGEVRAQRKMPARVVSADLSDTGRLIAVVVEGPRLLLFDAEFEPVADRDTLSEPLAVAVDPHGRYAAVSSRLARTQLYTRYGKHAGSFATMQPLAYLRFIATEPGILGASALGNLFAISLQAGSSAGGLECEELWRSQMMSNVGGLSASGDASLIVASCFTHGVQRFDEKGRNEGAYHLGGTAGHAVCDFTGRLIAVATTEGELCLLNRGGNIRWKTGLGRGPCALVIDALGRYVVHGQPTGEIVRLDLEDSGAAPGKARRPARKPGATTRSGSGQLIREAAWTCPFADSDEQAETSVLAVLDDPPRVGAISNRNRLTLFTLGGECLGQAPMIQGPGRLLATAPGWMAATTDRNLVLFDARRNVAQPLDLNLVQLTHLRIRPDDYGLCIVQERDRVGRCTVAGRWIWKRELRRPIEEIAIAGGGFTAYTSEDGTLTILDPAGERLGEIPCETEEPVSLVAAPAEAPEGLMWVSLARRSQLLRGHTQDGEVIWESDVPFEAWQLEVLEPRIVAEAPDGRAAAFDLSGDLRQESRAESAPGPLGITPEANVFRMTPSSGQLLCTDLGGKVLWRSLAPATVGPIAVGRAGVVALIGRALAWFPAAGSEAADPPAP